MSLFMSCLMSFIICFINFGLAENIIRLWLESWGTAFIIAYPVVLIVNPVVRRLVDLVVDN